MAKRKKTLFTNVEKGQKHKCPDVKANVRKAKCLQGDIYSHTKIHNF